MRSLTDNWSLRTTSVLRNFRIHAVGPGCNPSSKVVHFSESGLLQEGDGFRAASAHFAVDNDLAAGIQFAHTLRQIVQRNEISADVDANYRAA